MEWGCPDKNQHLVVGIRGKKCSLCIKMCKRFKKQPTFHTRVDQTVDQNPAEIKKRSRRMTYPVHLLPHLIFCDA